MTVPEILQRTAREFGRQPAACYQGTWRSYGELLQASELFADFLIKSGVGVGERVAILLENSFDYIISHFGVLLAGAVEVSLNSELKADDLEALLVDSDAVVLISGRRQAREWTGVVDRLRELRFVVSDVDPEKLPQLPGGVRVYFIGEITGQDETSGRTLDLPTRNDDDLASIVYTSGSTGTPKGVQLTHANLVSNARAIADYLGLRATDRMMVVLPFHYIYGRSLLYTHFLTGGSIVIDNRFAYPSAILNTMEEFEVTCFAGVPTTFSILLRKTDVARRQLPRLRLLTQAGGAMAPALQREVCAALPSASLFVMYGATEASPRLTYLDPKLLPEKWGSIGSAIPGVEVVVADQSGCALPAEEVGEIIARGPNIMKGYWKDDAGTSKALRNGWYWTGDTGYADSDGCLFVTGRVRDFIKSGGHRIGPQEIEEKLLDVPGISDAAVIGVPDEILGEAIKAYVVLSNSAMTEDQIRSHLRTHLPSPKMPKYIEFLNEMPKNSAGKILKEVLRQGQP